MEDLTKDTPIGFPETAGDKGLKLGAGTYVLQVGKRKFARVTLA